MCLCACVYEKMSEYVESCAAMSSPVRSPVRLLLLMQAIELNPTYSKHLLYSNRSAALLQSKRAEEALADAEAAIRLGPKDYTTVRVCARMCVCVCVCALVAALRRTLTA